jgi:8-oxo-dGTP diphosphatase
VTRFAIVPAAYLLLMRGEGDDLEVLLQLRGPGLSFRPGHWATAAAGHVEPGESAFAAAAREALEELGVVVDPDDLSPLCAMQRTQPGVSDPLEQRVDFFFTARTWSGEPEVREPDKCSALAWHRPSALPEPMVPHEQTLLGLLATGEVPAVVTYGY